MVFLSTCVVPPAIEETMTSRKHRSGGNPVIKPLPRGFALPSNRHHDPYRRHGASLRRREHVETDRALP
jgi:hypothetical protein